MTVEREITTTFAGTLVWDHAITKRNLVPANIAIYAVCTEGEFPRLIGSTNVLYIGSTTLLGGLSVGARLYSYRYSPQSQPKDIRERVAAVQAGGNKVTLKWLLVSSENEARAIESRLLSEYRKQHLEYPPFNGKG